jgi:hypothetical protein
VENRERLTGGTWSALDARCAKHQFEAAHNFCRQCGHPFCARCLVYPFGERKPPYCIPCALVVAGVRSGGRKAPRASWRERRAQKRAALAGPAVDETAGFDDDDGATDDPVPLEPAVHVDPPVDPTWNEPLSGEDPWFTPAQKPSTRVPQPAPTQLQPWTQLQERTFG